MHYAIEQRQDNQRLRGVPLWLFVRFQDIGCLVIGHLDP
jgi:hypothetical protein